MFFSLFSFFLRLLLMALIRERILHRWSRITLDLNQHGSSSRDRQPGLIRD